MSNAVVLTSNNAEFENYLSDTFKLKKNSEVCLTKASISVPVEIHQFVTIPSIEAGDRNDVVFTANVDGVERSISWNNIYNTYSALDTNNGFEPLLADDFFSGQVDLPLSNFVIFKDSNGVLKKRADISELLASAFDSQFDFYSVIPTPKLTALNYQRISHNTGVISFNNNTYSIERVEPYSAEVGLKFRYDPKKQELREAVCSGNLLWSDNGSTTVTDDATNGCSIVATGSPASAFAPKPIDPNGGYIMFKLENQANNSDFTFGLAQLFARNPSNNVTSTNILFGINVVTSASGNITIQVKDGATTVPASASATAQAGDHYFIQVQRRGTIDPVYVCSLYVNYTDADISDAVKIYESVIRHPDASSLVPVYTATAIGGEISNLRMVEISDDSVSMLVSYGIANEPELVGTCSISANPQARHNHQQPACSLFFQQLGFTFGNYPINTSIDYHIRNFAHKANELVQVHTTPRTCYDNLAVNVGAQSVADTLYEKTLPGGGKVLAYRNKGSKVPRFLDVALRNMPVKSLAGNLAATGFTTASITRDVCHIPTPADTLDATSSFDLNLSYEPYNPVYRQLNNTEHYNVNQLQVDVGYKDFYTNEAKQIKNINGNLKLELHFRPSKNRIA